VSSASHLRKILIVAFILVVVGLAGVGSYFTFNKPTAPYNVTSMSSGTTPTSSTQTKSETASTTVVPTRWVTVGQVKSIDYYLSLLESNGTQPYVQLARELRKIPGVTNATAVAKITYLALNATNPEVKEAFELMMKGGTPDQRDFAYTVPRYNTELQVLYWLALENEFKKDDTTALAIAMVNGLWVTVGDNEVRNAVSKDSNELLSYLRETDEILGGKGLWSPEAYPLEAKVALAWTGSLTPVYGPFNLVENFERARLSLRGYLWNTVSIETLREMRSMLTIAGAMLPNKSMLETKLTMTVHNLEYYFYFMNPRGASSEHWDYADPGWDDTAKKITLDNLVVDNHHIFNIDGMFHEQYLKTGKLSGGCMDETAWVDSWAKSLGIATTGLWHWGWDKNYKQTRFSHIFNIYYDPLTDRWTADEQQLAIGLGTGERYQLTRIFKPPVNQHRYLAIRLYYRFITGDFFFTLGDLTEEDIYNKFLPGPVSSTVKDWLLYAKSTTSIAASTIQEGKWSTLTDGLLDVYGENGSLVGDLGRPYVDVANVSYSCTGESIYVRFGLNAKIPQSVKVGEVTAIWYQVLIDVDPGRNTGAIWDDYFAPDYMLEFYVRFDGSSGTAKASAFVLKYSGNGTDWTKWTEIESSSATVEGGLGSDSLTIRCGYRDIGVAKGSQVVLIFRSGILYEGNVYNDPDPDAGPISLILP